MPLSLRQNLFIALAALGAASLWGCNASTNQSSSSGALSRALRLNVSFPPVTRQVPNSPTIGAPVSAMSAEITLKGARADRGDVVLKFNRRLQLDGYQEIISSGREVVPGNYVISGRYFADLDQKGPVLATLNGGRINVVGSDADATIDGSLGDFIGATTQDVPDATPALSINWAARSRVLNAPSSARFARFTLTDPDFNVPEVSTTATRRDAPAAYSQTISLPATRIGPKILTATFFASEGGDTVASASVLVILKPDGSGIGDIALTGQVASVAVNRGQSVPATNQPQPQSLIFTARTADGQVLALSPGSAFWTSSNSSVLSLTADGIPTGRTPGTANVTVRIDGITSAPEPVVVTGGA